MAERRQILEWVDEAVNAGARLDKACEIIGLSSRTLQRWRQPDKLQADQRTTRQFTPSNKLTNEEMACIVTTALSSEFKNMAPSQIVPILADRGEYIASESSFYRILKERKLMAHRHATRVPTDNSKPKAVIATAPNQLYSWDITYLATTIKGLFFYLYLFMDIFSRKIVGWQVYGEESSIHAADIIRDICQRECIEEQQVTLHSDNGSPMKGATMLATLQKLGVIPSLSRPGVSNDNPYSESLFKTLKYRPEYPSQPFADLIEARAWVDDFVHWYNTVHRHSSICFVTPEQRHKGEDKAILLRREVMYHKARAANPTRWSKNVRNWKWIAEVHLNPDKSNASSSENTTDNDHEILPLRRQVP